MVLNFLDLLYGISVLLVLTLGLLSYLDNPKEKSRVIFFIYSLGALFWIATIYFGYMYADAHNYDLALAIFRLAYGFSLSAMASMTVFIYYFPNAYPALKKIYKFIFILITLALFLISVFTPWIHKDLILRNNVYISDKFGPLYFLYMAYISLNLIAAIILSVIKIKKTSGIERSKIYYTFYSYIVGVSLVIITNVILPIFGIFSFERYSVFFSLIFIFSAYYAINRYRFFHFSNFAHNLLRRLILIAVYVISLLVLYKLLDFAFSLNQDIHIALSATISLYLYALFDAWLPKILSASYKEFLGAINHLRSALYSSDSFEALQKNIEDTFVIKLNMAGAKLYAVRDKALKSGMNVYLRDDFTKNLKFFAKDALVIDELNYRKINPKTKKILIEGMNKIGYKICLPLFSGDNIIGFLALSPDKSSAYMTKDSIKEIIGLRKGLSISLMNALINMNLQEENNMMKIIIDKKTKLLKEKYKVIKTLLSQQSDFIAVTAHELRTPLNVAILQANDLLESGKLTGTFKDGFDMVIRSLEKLKNLVQKLFEVQQYDLNKVEFKPVKTSLSEFIKSIYVDIKPIIKQKNISLKLNNKANEGLFALLDVSQMSRAVNNLITNAGKFTGKGGKISLETYEENGRLIIKISDNGPGIPNNLKEKVFEKFKTRSGGGLGLGLYLCKKIVELHKGKIWCEDTPGGGATFFISLPF